MEGAWKGLESSDWHDLNLMPESFDLRTVPAEFWLLHTFYIALEHAGKHYLVIEYPSYGRPDSGLQFMKLECIWSPPYLAHKLETGYSKYTVVGHIRKLYEDFNKANSGMIQQQIETKFYHMGISYRTANAASDVFELKRSPREPNKWKCYYVKRFLVWDLDVLGRRNVVDPECLMPYRYLCLTDHAALLDRPDPKRPYYQLFRGKPLSTNLSYLFMHDEIALFQEHATAVKDAEFTYREKGLMLSFDLISFGEFHSYLEQQFRSLDKTGTDIAREFDLQIDGLLRRNLVEFGYYQYRIEGDGFIASCPQRHYSEGTPEEQRTGKQVLRTLALLRKVVQGVNEIINISKVEFGARAVLMDMEYDFGKTGGFYADSAGHAGKSLITLARMQEASRDWVKRRGEKKGIYVFTLPELYDLYCNEFTLGGFKEIDRFMAREKETENMMVVLTIG